MDRKTILGCNAIVLVVSIIQIIGTSCNIKPAPWRYDWATISPLPPITNSTPSSTRPRPTFTSQPACSPCCSLGTPFSSTWITASMRWWPVLCSFRRWLCYVCSSPWRSTVRSLPMWWARVLPVFLSFPIIVKIDRCRMQLRHSQQYIHRCGHHHLGHESACDSHRAQQSLVGLQEVGSVVGAACDWWTWY